MKKFCECGCGREVKEGKRFILGHNKGMLGKRHSEETIEKMSGNNHPFFGKKRPEHSLKISGKNHPMYGKHPTEKTLKKMSKNHRKFQSIQTRKKISEANKGKHRTEEQKRRMSESRPDVSGKKHPMYGRKNKWGHHTKETKRKLRLMNSGENNPMYGRTPKPETIQKLKDKRAKLILPTKDTSIEIKIQNFLKQLGIDFFTHQYMKIEHGYQCDILIPSMNLVIECDGDFIHCNPTKYSPDFVRFPSSKHNQPASVVWELDDTRTKELIQQGFRVLRLWENEIKKMELNDFKEKIGK